MINLLDFATISSVILFAISLFTFITSLISKAQSDGKILARIEQMQNDVAEIKQTLKEKGKDLEGLKIITENQEQRIKHLETLCEHLENRVLAIETKG